MCELLSFTDGEVDLDRDQDVTNQTAQLMDQPGDFQVHITFEYTVYFSVTP